MRIFQEQRISHKCSLSEKKKRSIAKTIAKSAVLICFNFSVNSSVLQIMDDGCLNPWNRGFEGMNGKQMRWVTAGAHFLCVCREFISACLCCPAALPG